jgi:PhoH-like ATPase
LAAQQLKRVVVDTNVLLDRPLYDVLKSFGEPTHVIIPLVVLNELDKFKKGHDPINEHCRATTRFLDELRTRGQLDAGVPYEGHWVQVLVKAEDLDLKKNDHQIIKAARDEDAALISQDINVRVIADSLKIDTQNFAPEDVNVSKLYSGVRHIDITKEELKEFYSSYPIQGFDVGTRRLVHNQFVIMKDPAGGIHQGIYDSGTHSIQALKHEYRAWGIKPKKDKEGNEVLEQKFLLHLLLDPSIEFVSAIGPSGSGKTLLTLAAALEQVLGKDGIYNRVVVMRPLIPVGKDIGYLPGNKLEKLSPWMASTFDALEYLLEKEEDKDDKFMASSDKIQRLIDNKFLELEALAHLRGRSIPGQFIIVDDAQNLTAHEAATIITRAAEGSKVVFLGDISSQQIDDHRLTPSSNGLTYTVDKFKGEDIVGHITLETVVRSKLAQLGVEKLQ